MQKIILVESNPELINIYQQAFQKTDFDVELASRQEEMLEELHAIRTGGASKPDLVILDLMLADGHGVEILKAMKKSFITHDIPVFAITNYQNPDLDREIKNQNIAPEKYLIKAHYTPFELVDIVNDYFAQKASPRPALA